LWLKKVLGYGFTMYQRRIEAFMLDANYYHTRADLCLKLAHAALAARPLCVRLISLADDYKAKAEAAELNCPQQSAPSPQ
jgi:hypothetical protein